MSERFSGGFITKTPVVPTSTSASGIWTLDQQEQAQQAGTWPSPPPPNYIEDVFSTWLYQGNSSTQTITNGIDLAGKGGMTWIKSRSNASTNVVYDTARGANNYLRTNATDAQNGLGSVTDEFTAFNSNGFTLEADTAAQWANVSARTYASWTFRKQPKFFDVVTYTGNGSNQTISHSLGSAPGCIIVKCTSNGTTNWFVYHSSLAVTSGRPGFMYLDSTSAVQTGDPTVWPSVPTSTTFEVGSYNALNGSGRTYVAYLFAHNAGGFGLTGTDNVISCGSYTTDGSGKATVNLGYEPQWLLRKRSDAVSDWIIVDNMRGWPLGSAQTLAANNSDQEFGGGYANSITSTGFTVSDAASRTYIYIAIRKGPMKVPTDGTKVFTAITRNGTSANATVTGASFSPDLVFPDVYNVGGTGAATFSRLIGPNKYTVTYSTAAEVTETASLLSYDMNGFSVGADNTGNGQINLSGNSYVNWLFGRAPSFFDEVCYTGTGATTTYSHNLAAAPELMIIKRRNSSVQGQWRVFYTNYGPTNYGEGVLNTTAAISFTPAYDGSWDLVTKPTTTSFQLLDVSNANLSGATYVAYLFATCAGVSKVGSYTGNGSTQTINCNFTGGARFVLIKRTDAVGDWYIYDTARGMTTLTDPYLRLNNNGAQTATLGSVTTVTTGFAVNASILAAINTSGASYIFLAIA